MDLLFYFGCCILVILDICIGYSFFYVSVGYGERFIDGALRRGFGLWILVLCFGFEEMFGAHFEVSYWVIGGLWVEEVVG